MRSEIRDKQHVRWMAINYRFIRCWLGIDQRFQKRDQLGKVSEKRIDTRDKRIESIEIESRKKSRDQKSVELWLTLTSPTSTQLPTKYSCTVLERLKSVGCLILPPDYQLLVATNSQSQRLKIRYTKKRTRNITKYDDIIARCRCYDKSWVQVNDQ